MRDKRIGLLALVLMSYSPFVPAESAAAAPQPRIELVGPNIVNLGLIPNYQMTNATFRLRNTGAVPVQIKNLVSTCSCIQGSADKLLLQTNEESVVTVHLNTLLVHGIFQRGLWVETDDPTHPRLMLSVKGEVCPLFTGLPPMPISFRANKAGQTSTNRYTLTATEAGVVLGAPSVTNDPQLRVEFSIETNASERMSYALTLIVTPLALGHQKAALTFPVKGRPALRASPLTFRIEAQTGAELRVTPSKIVVYPSDKAIVRRMLIQTSETVASTNDLSWTPQLAGVNISVESLGKANLTVMLEIPPPAVTNLLSQENVRLSFHYPDYKSAEVQFIRIKAPETRKTAISP